MQCRPLLWGMCCLQSRGILTIGPKGVTCLGGLPPMAHFLLQNNGRIKLLS